MTRNKEFTEVLDELIVLHNMKNKDYATAENPYKNLEGVSRIGIEPWRGIVIRLMDKFSRVEEFCVKGELAVKEESIKDTFMDIAIYSVLAIILRRKSKNLKESQGKEWELPELPDSPEWELPPERPSLFPADDTTQELTEIERGKGSDECRRLEGDWDVDYKDNADESYTHPMIAMRESAEKQQAMEDTERLRETLQAREERKEEERLANDKKGFLNAIDKLEAERRARDN